MYRFHSLAETPVRLNGHWYTVMVGINPNRETTNLKRMQDNLFDFFILNRNPKEGIYVEGAELDKVAAFLSFAHHNPAKIIDLHKKYAKSGLTNPTVTLEGVIKQEGIDLMQPIEDF